MDISPVIAGKCSKPRRIAFGLDFLRTTFMQLIPPSVGSKRSAPRHESVAHIAPQTGRDLTRDEPLDMSKRFLPDSLAMTDRLDFLRRGEQRLLNQIQGRTYVHMLGILDRVIGVKTLGAGGDGSAPHEKALDAVVRLDGPAPSHESLFRRIGCLAAYAMPPGYHFLPQDDDVTRFVLSKSTWSVLGLTCLIGRVAQAHYESVEADPDLSHHYSCALYLRWHEQSVHTVLDELAWRRENASLLPQERDVAANDLSEVVQGVDALLVFQAPSDVDYFLSLSRRAFTAAQIEQLNDAVLAAYRRQYICLGWRSSNFLESLEQLTTIEQRARLNAELAPMMPDRYTAMPSIPDERSRS